MKPAALVRGILVGIPNEILEKVRLRLLAADISGSQGQRARGRGGGATTRLWQIS